MSHPNSDTASQDDSVDPFPRSEEKEGVLETVSAKLEAMRANRDVIAAGGGDTTAVDQAIDDLERRLRFAFALGG